jgi:hypothetical protein
LVEEGDKERALKVLDRCLEVMPEKNVPYDVFVVRLAEGYYGAGAVDKGNKLIRDVVKVYTDRYNYFASFRKLGKGGAAQNELEECSQILGYCQQVAEFHKQDALAKELKDGQAKLVQ